MKFKKLLSIILAAAMVTPTMALPAFAEEDSGETVEIVETEQQAEGNSDYSDADLFADGNYSCNFASLVKNGADTTYGTAEDVIQIDDYTTAHLTYEGTYIKADGTLYLTGSNAGRGAYTNGSYIEFTAPSDGTLTPSFTYCNYYINGTYGGYSAEAVSLQEGQKYQIGERKNLESYLTGFTFVPTTATPTSTPEATDEPAGEVQTYLSPSTTWDFSSSPSASGKDTPVISGTATYNGTTGEVEFPSDTKDTGYLSLDFSNPIAHSASYDKAVISFDAKLYGASHGGAVLAYSLFNSEGEEIVSVSCHPYQADSYNSNYIKIGGQTIVSDNEDVRNFIKVGAQTMTVTVDYNARKVTVQCGDKSFSGDISESTAKDISKLTISSSRTKNNATDRYYALDNLVVTESKSTEAAAQPPTVTEGYEEKTFGGVNSRVKAAQGNNIPLLVYLCGSIRFGTDNYSQLYNAKDMFDLMNGKAILAAPQTATAWDTNALKAYIAAAKSEYNAGEVIVAGQFEGAAAAYALADTADKIIPIAGTSNITASKAKVWAFGGFLDDVTGIANIRKPVNALQTSMVDVRYTEYPTIGHNIAKQVSQEAGLSEWILGNDSADKVVDLVLFAGQSNMAGRGSAVATDDEPAAITCPVGEGYEFHSITNPNLASGEVPYVLSTASEPFGKNDNNSKIHDSGSDGKDRRSGDMVGAVMKSYYEKTGVPIVGVQASRGGQGTSYFLTNDYKTDCAERYTAAENYLQASGYTVRRKFVVWCQGENDGEGTLNGNYKTATINIFNNMKALGMTDMFMVKIGHRNNDTAKDAQYKQINTWQQELSDENEDMHAVANLYTDKYFARMRDQYHYYQDVYNEIGTTAGGNIADIFSERELDVNDFEITSSESEIDISGLKNYGATQYRVYSDEGSTDVTAAGGKVTNPYGGEVTVVPIYRFNYTNAAMAGYTTATGTYTKSTGYGILSGVDYKVNANGAYPLNGPLKIDVPDGRYDITVDRRGGMRFNVFNNGTQIMTNDGIGSKQNRDMSSAVMYAPQVPSLDSSLNITVSAGRNGNERIATVEAVRVPDRYKKRIVWVAGDSESSNYFPINKDGDDLQSNKIMMTGFGMQIQKFLPDNKFRIANFGEPDSTVVAWYNNHFNHIYRNMSRGDILLVDFGINDGNKNIGVDTMKNKMAEIFTAAKAKGVQPILVSPVWNNKYQHKTYFTYDKNNNTNAMYAFAREQDVPCIDLNKGSMLYKDKAIQDTGDSNWAVYNYHVEDNLHQTQHSALLNAAIIVGGMKELGYDTTDYSYTYKDISAFGSTDGVEDKTVRGTESGVTRVYSIDALKDYVTVQGEADIPTATAVPTMAPSTEPTGAPSHTQSPTTAPKPLGTLTYNEGDKKVIATTEDSSINKATLIKAVYEGGIMKSADMYEVGFTDGRAEKVLPIEKGSKLFLWDNINSMKPVTNEYNYTGEGTVEATPTPTVKPTPEPTNAPVVNIDFEGTVAMNSKGDAPLGWKQSNGGKATLKTASGVSSIGQYMEQGNAGGGPRAVEYAIDPAITDNFVFEADILTKSTAEYSANLSLLSSSTTVNSTATNKVPMDGFLFKTDILRNSDKAVINNVETSNDTYVSDIKGKKVMSDSLPANQWIHVRAICDFTNKVTTTKLTSLDGNTVYFDGKTDISPEQNADLKRIYLVAPRPGGTFGIDNITVRRANNSEMREVGDYIEATIVNRGTTYKYYSKKNQPLDSRYIPDVSMYGSNFKGWLIDDATTPITTDNLKTVALTNNTTITASVDEAYVEKVSEVSFSKFPENGNLIMSADANGDDFNDNAISLKITGETGTDLAANPDSRANGTVAWEFIGFHTMHGVPTGDDKTTTFPGEKRYCDNYAYINVENNYDSEVSFALRNTTENYYGKVRATVTYAGQNPIVVERPLVILANNATPARTLYPTGGFISDFDKMEDGIEGDYTENKLLLNGWSIAGSAANKKMGIGKDSGGKYMTMSKVNSNSDSCYFSANLEKTANQIVFDQRIRFNTASAAVSYKAEAISGNNNKEAFGLVYSGNTLKINNTALADNVSKNTWYRLVISAAASSGKVFAKLYAADGTTLLGETSVLNFTNAVAEPYAYGYRITDKSTGVTEIDINKLTIREAGVNQETMTLNLGSAAMTIPDGDTPATLNISVDNIKTTDGFDAIGAATWKVADDSADGVSVQANADTHTATVTVDKTAAAGVVPIAVTIDGVTVQGNITLTGTRDAVAFTNKVKSVLIPTGGNQTAQFTAVLRDGNGNEKAGDITYSLESAPSGVSIDSATGVMTVTSTAAPSEVSVVATSGTATRKAKVTLYKLDFAFGTTAVAGKTLVGAEDVYDADMGFGIEGTAAGEAGYISGSNLAFKAKVENGKVYSVKVKYKGTVTLERLDDYLTGIKKDTTSSLTEKTYEVAVVGDGVLDINLYGSSQQLAAVEITPKTDKAAGAKPGWIEIGDSTVAQNPSWGYVLANDYSKYNEIKNATDNFKNMGRGARQLTSFYNEGLLDAVLREVRPGDVVSISGMGTNGYDGTIETFKRHLNYYIDSVIDMGGKVILGSYTPFGNWGTHKDTVYNTATETFVGKRYADYDIALKEVYDARKDEAEILGYVDIGGMADTLMTAEVKKARDAQSGDENAKKAAAQAKAEELMRWWPNDFNHYTADLSNLILPELTKAVAGIISQ